MLSMSVDRETVLLPTVALVEPFGLIVGSWYSDDSHAVTLNRAWTHPGTAGAKPSAETFSKYHSGESEPGEFYFLAAQNVESTTQMAFFLRFVPEFSFTVFAWLLNRVIDLLSYCMGEPIRHDPRYQ